LAERRLRQQKLPRVALDDPLAQTTSWNLLFGSRNDQALITLTGYNHRASGSTVCFMEMTVRFSSFPSHMIPIVVDNQGSEGSILV
jgi:hypothetical protein